MTTEIECPYCGSTDVRKLIGEIWLCRDCGKEFTVEEHPTPPSSRASVKVAKIYRFAEAD